MPLSDTTQTLRTLHALLDVLPIGVAIAHDPACSFISVNPAAAKMLRISVQSNASLSSVADPPNFKVFHNGRELSPEELPMQRAAAAGMNVHDLEVDVVHADGTVVPLLEYATPLRDAGGRIIGCIGLFIDMTAQRESTTRQAELQRESEARAREFNDTFESRVAQRTADATQRAEQLRTLALALADAEARERKRLAQALHDQLQQLLSAAKLKAAMTRRGTTEEVTRTRIQQLEQLIEGAIAESRTLTLELAPPVLYDAGLNAAIEALTRDIERRRGLKFELQCDPAAEPEEEQVRVLVFEAVREMIQNVVMHAEARNVRITSQIPSNGLVLLSIEDDGKGFDIASLQAPRARNDCARFGLLEIRERLSHIGGQLQISSSPGRGTLVTLQLPAKLRVTPTDVPPAIVRTAPTTPPRYVGPASATNRARVIVADDHPLFREGLIGVLNQEDFLQVVGVASDGEEAVALARELKPDVMIVDISMPKLNGLQVTEIVAREIPETRIIGLSMHDRADMAAAMKSAGAVAYLSKGGASETLVALLRTLVNRTPVS